VDTINRRRFLALAGLSAAGAWMGTARALAAQVDATALNPRNLLASPRFASTPFTLGVASGDPSADGMVLWTRLATEPLVFGGGSGRVRDARAPNPGVPPCACLHPLPVAIRPPSAGPACHRRTRAKASQACGR